MNDTSKPTHALRPETHLVHGGSMRSGFGETSEALFLTQSFVYDSAEQAEARFQGDEPGFIYSRFSNPTIKMLEDRLCLLEGAEACRVTASGMAAVTAAMLCSLSAGDHVVAARALFGSCRYVVEDLLPRFGIETTLVDGRDLDAWKAARRPNTKVFFLETPSNPTLEVIDLQAVADIAHEGGAKLYVDNVFATPLYQRPMQFGADVVIYSATKHMDGQGRCLAGAVLADETWINDHLHNYLRQTGPSLSPFNAWVILKSLETFALRVNQQADNATALADLLAAHPDVARVLYPHRNDHPDFEVASRQMTRGGTLIAFEVDGGKAEAFSFLNRLGIIKISNNLGDAKSLITHPSTTTHQRLEEADRLDLGIHQNLLRLSVGLEHVDDLWDDLSSALR
ncbi:O-succinylhomoserine sulfhydrylase [Ahrensia marina]|uniref:O-succinylhomoserine sulfhydrylase n=1 Tax=Ahrensia marina TaxID=1514904 RepID=UPI0035CFF4B5